MKKLISILLVCLLALSVPMTCFAAGGEGEITGFAAAVNKLAASLEDRLAEKLIVAGGQNLDAVVAGAFEGLDVDVSPAKAAAPLKVKATLSGSQSLKTAADSFAKYLFIPVSDPSEVAGIIAESCEFDYAVVADEKGTVYIKVNVEENPEIFNFSVFRNLVDQLYAGQNEKMAENADGSTDYLMSYEHIAGELALHMLVYAATSEIISLSGSGNDKILDLYNSAKLAELNYDESRLPSKWLNAIGRLIVVMFRFDIFRIIGA